MRRRAVHERAGHDLQEGSLSRTHRARWRRRHRRRPTSPARSPHAYISPVLTAHPTEVQRKSILDAERAIAELLGRARRAAQRARARRATRRCSAPASRSSGRRACCATPSSPWPTRSRTRCATTAPPSCARFPRSIAELEERCPASPVAPFFRMGNWIGGDRDGNPNVDRRDACASRCARQGETALRYYLTEVHELGAELSMSAHAASAVTPATAGAGRRARPTPTRTATTSPTAAR